MCQAVEHIGKSNVFHGDLNPKNIMVDEMLVKKHKDGTLEFRTKHLNKENNVWDEEDDNVETRYYVVINDFGRAEIIENMKDTFKGESIDEENPLYTAPEVLNARLKRAVDYSKADLFSVGCLAFNFMNVPHPFEEITTDDVDLNEVFGSEKLSSTAYMSTKSGKVKHREYYSAIDICKSIPKKYSSRLKHFVQSLIEMDISKRPTPSEAVRQLKLLK